MYAIVEVGGKQFRVEKDMTLKVPYLSDKIGASVEFDRVLLIDTGKEVKVGKPLVEGAKIKAKIVDHGRDKKVLVFKKKRRKGYRVLNGHRQHFSKVEIKKLLQK